MGKTSGTPGLRYGLGGILLVLLLTFGATGQAQDAGPQGTPPAASDLESVLAEADAALAAGRNDEAIGLYSRLLENPGLPVAAYPLLFVRRAAAFSSQGDRLEAMADFDAAAELAPDDPDLRFYRGVALLQAGDTEAAIADLNRSLAAQPGNPQALAARARAFYLRRDYDRALTDAEAALRVAPRDPMALAGRGEIALAQGRYRDALADLDLAIEQEPRLAPAYRSRIAVNEALGAWERIAPDLAKLYELGERSPAFLAKARSYGVEAVPE